MVHETDGGGALHLDPPDELFDLCDDRGRLIGETKPRALVHRDGDWHRAFHCWVVTPADDGSARVILQQRSMAKLTNPGKWDVSVGGHYAAGEGIEGGLREIREELGLEVTASDLIHVARRRDVVDFPNGVHEREVQDVYFLWSPLQITDLNPDPTEVSAIALVSSAVLRRLARGTTPPEIVEGAQATPSGLIPRSVTLQQNDLVGARRGTFYTRAAHIAEQLANGAPLPSRWRWW